MKYTFLIYIRYNIGLKTFCVFNLFLSKTETYIFGIFLRYSMLEKFLREVVIIVVGKHAESIADLLDSPKYVNEFIIAKKLDITINQTRNILYKLSDHGLVSSVRKKDKKKGWYTYFWKIEILKSLEFLKAILKKRLDQINNQIKNRESTEFYICERCKIEFNEENALLNNFTCNECGDIFTIKDNFKILKELKKNSERLVKEMELVDQELSKETEKVEKKKAKQLKKEAEEKAAKRKAARKKTVAKRKAEAKKAGKKKPVKKSSKKKPVKKKTVKKKIVKKSAKKKSSKKTSKKKSKK